MLKAILFDMDGVIVNTEPLHHKAYYHMFSDVNIEVSDNLYASFTGQSTMAICKELCKQFNLPLAPETLVEIKRDHFKYLFENDTELALIDGVLDLIKDYHSNGLTLVLASSASMPNINNIFKRFDLDQYFIAKLSGADLKASKPHPEMLEHILRRQGLTPQQCLMVGDTTYDMQMAQSLGMDRIGVDYGVHQPHLLHNHKPKAIISAPLELLKHI